MNQKPIEYSFPIDPEAAGYRLFPRSLEDDDHIFFHGTALSCLEPILANGFRIPPHPLAQSVSFAKNSSLSLGYACIKRSPDSPDGCVIAVRYEISVQKCIVMDTSMLHDYKCDPQPVVIAFCIVPAAYRHI